MTKSLRQKNIDKTLKSFPKHLKKRQAAATERKKFTEKTFGKLAKQLNKIIREKREL